MDLSHPRRIALISVHGDPAVEIGKEEAGGQNVYVRNVGEALARQGWQVEMFTRSVNSAYPKVIEHQPGCQTIRLTAGPEEYIPRDCIFEYAHQFVEELRKFQAQQGFFYPLVHTNYWISGWVGMALKQYQPVQQVHVYHSLGAVKYNTVQEIPSIAKTRLETEKAILETAERVVATSPQEKEHMRSLVSDQGTIDIIPCGTDLERFGAIERSQARQKLAIPPDQLVVFYVGRFDPRKGIETLIRAVNESKFRDHPQLQVIIGGGSRPGQADGLERDRLEQLVSKLNLSHCVTFPGRISDDLLPIYYAAADVCVVPSHYEPFGLVALEAMASRTPVIASQVGGLKFTVLPETTGLLVPPQDHKAFTQAIDRILNHASWRDRLGEAGREYVQQKFSWEGVAAQLSTLYTHLLEQK